MIVSYAPFRVGFADGGSDIAQFDRRARGAVTRPAIIPTATSIEIGMLFR
jgi:galactokinase/mevalonate kinase-like predicted kinase